MELSVKITLESTSTATKTLQIFYSHMEENNKDIVTIEVKSRVIFTNNSRVIFHVGVT